MTLTGRPINLNRFPDGIDGRKGGFFTRRCRPMRRTGCAAGQPERRQERDPRVPDDRRRAGAGVGGQLRRLRDPPVDVDGGVPDEPSYALIDIDPGRDDGVGRHAHDGPTVPRGDGPARPRRSPEGHRQARHPDLDPGQVRATRSDRRPTSSRRCRKTVGRVVSELVSWRWTKNDRRGLARLDYTQNQVNKTLVAPYSIRPAPGAPVSVPLEWDELDDPKLRPDRWTIRDVLNRLDKVGDPFQALVGVEQDLPPL